MYLRIYRIFWPPAALRGRATLPARVALCAADAGALMNALYGTAVVVNFRTRKKSLGGILAQTT